MYVHKLNLKKTKFMNKMIMNRLTMLAVTLMASMACFAQGKMATTISDGKQVGDVFDYLELKYKVTGNSAGYTVQVIGFADAFEADPTKFDTSEEIDALNTVTIPHYIGKSTDVAVQVYVQSIADGALNTSDATLASKVTAITIQYVDNEKTLGNPVIIGENAFAGLTSVTKVESFIPGAKVAAIPDNAFATAIYKKPLIVPEGKMGKYAATEGWKKFNIIKTEDGQILGNMNTDARLTTGDYTLLLTMIKTRPLPNPIPDYADMNGDGRLTTGDAAILLDIVKRK